MNTAPPTQSSTKAPGIALMVVGILSLLSSGWFGFQAYRAMGDEDAIAAAFDGMSEEQKEQMKGMGDPAEVMKTIFNWMAIISGIGVLLAGAMVLGGFSLMSSGNKMLGILGGVAAMLPNWCCLLGLPIGIWAVISAMKSGPKN